MYDPRIILNLGFIKEILDILLNCLRGYNMSEKTAANSVMPF